MKKIYMLLVSMCVGIWGISAQGVAPLVYEQLSIQGDVACMVVLKSQAAPLHLDASLPKEEKTKRVYGHLSAWAEVHQADFLTFLEGEEVIYRAYWIMNAVACRLSRATLERVLEHPEVAYVYYDMPIRQAAVTPVRTPALARMNLRNWGIDQIKASFLWDLGFKGQGVIIGGQDTGFDWAHESLKGQYRGWNGTTAEHAYNWHDAIREIHPVHQDAGDTVNNCGLNLLEPCDDGSHGTHTMGTMVGAAEGFEIGIAPEARWIGCRNMEEGWGTVSSYLECFEWFLAPTDLTNTHADPSLAPDIINNSWACPLSEGCNPMNFYVLDEAVKRLREVGVFVVVSAGNAGPDCETVNTPAAIFAESYTVAASTPEDSIAAFSSRGPVTVDASGRLKPDISAPGVNILSSVPGNGYAAFNGTSMAGPHVAAAAALLMSVDPSLKGNVARIEELLRLSAKPIRSAEVCGAYTGFEVPNFSAGYGRIDLEAALRLLRPELLGGQALKPADMWLYPNPGNGRCTLRTGSDIGTAQLTVVDILGRVHVHREVKFERVLPLDLQHLPVGWYWIQIENASYKQIERYYKMF